MKPQGPPPVRKTVRVAMVAATPSAIGLLMAVAKGPLEGGREREGGLGIDFLYRGMV